MSTSQFTLSGIIQQGDPYNESMAGRPPSKPAPAFGTQLSALRKARGLTQPQLAEELGITPEMLNYYERRAKNPSADFIAKASAFFGVTADELLSLGNRTARKSGPPSQFSRLAERLDQLPRTKQKFVIEMLEGLLKQTS
jgi:transcriptional regulator with XRE-family HTH domain